MIKLKVEDYCHDCLDFEADVTKNHEKLTNYDPFNRAENVIEYITTTIHCKHAARCRAIKRYLEKQKGEKA